MIGISLKAATVLVFGLVISLSPLSFAQNQASTKRRPVAQPAAERQWYSVAVVRVRPDMLTDWQEFQRNETIPALKKGGVKQREAWQTATFGEAYEYVFLTPIEDFARYDGESPIEKALGQEGARAYGAKARRLVVGSHSYAIQTRPDLSYEGTMTGPPKLAVVTSVEVAAGRNAAFESLIKTDVLPVMKRAKVPGYFVSQTVLGGNANEYVTVLFYDSFAEIGKGSPLIRLLGQQGYDRFLQKTAGIVVKVERTVARFNPNLSFGMGGSPPAGNERD